MLKTHVFETSSGHLPLLLCHVLNILFRRTVFCFKIDSLSFSTRHTSEKREHNTIILVPLLHCTSATSTRSSPHHNQPTFALSHPALLSAGQSCSAEFRQPRPHYLAHAPATYGRVFARSARNLYVVKVSVVATLIAVASFAWKNMVSLIELHLACEEKTKISITHD